MTKQVIRDYFSAFHWEKIKEFYKNGGWFFFLNMTVILPMFVRIFDSAIGAVNYYFALVPLEFAMFAAPLHPVALPKIMYLCPMSETERREYITKAFWFKFAVPVVVSGFCMSVLLALGVTDLLQAGMVLLENILVGLAFGLDGRAAFLGEAGFREPVIKDLRDWQPIAGVVGAVTACFVAFVAVGGREEGIVIMMLCVICLLQLPLTIKVMWYYRRIMDNALNYENVKRE